MEKIDIKGIFRLKIYDAKTGRLIEEYEDKNLVVNGGRTAVTKLLGGEGSGKSLTKIAFGTNSTAPTAADTLITGAYSKSLGSVSYPTVSSVRWNWELNDTEANGMAIVEFGILCNDNTLFARKTRDVINKNSSIRLVGTWEISF